MKRKKWSEVEERTLLSKYSDLLTAGTLPKLKTREKKFKPIADHVNSLHHIPDPITFPFKWSWRDVSIKVQNMRHQYMGVKQKIRISGSSTEFNWADGEIHWENFLKYKEVFGDIELSNKFGEEGISGILGYDVDSDEIEDEEGNQESSDGEREKEGNQELGLFGGENSNKGCKCKNLSMLGSGILELRDAIRRREEKKRDREERNEWEFRRENEIYMRENELEARQMVWMKREVEKRRRLEIELDEERKRRMKFEEKFEEEEMEWREKMVEMQILHEKQMMQMQADSCQNQMQILGVVARLVCQFFGTGNDGLGALPTQVLQNLQQGDEKPDNASPSEFL